MPPEAPAERDPRSVPAWKLIVFTLVFLGVVFGGIEGILAAMDYPPHSTLNIHEKSYWITEPGLEGSAFLHKELGTNFYVSTNDRSMRYRPIPVGRQAGTLRVMALGDSTTFGWGVNQTETYPAVLETLIADKVPGMKVEVINGGVPGYSTFQGLHHMSARVLAYESDLYLFGYIVQDARKAPISDKDQAISSRSAEFFSANPLYRWRTYLWMRDRYQLMRSAQREVEAKDGKTFRVPPDEYADNLRALATMAKGKDGVPVLFGFPLEVAGYTEKHREVMAQVAKDDGLDHFDPSPALAEAARRETLYFPQDRGHANAAGCAVIARQVADWLESSGVLARAAEKRR